MHVCLERQTNETIFSVHDAAVKRKSAVRDSVSQIKQTKTNVAKKWQILEEITG